MIWLDLLTIKLYQNINYIVQVFDWRKIMVHFWTTVVWNVQSSFTSTTFSVIRQCTRRWRLWRTSSVPTTSSRSPSPSSRTRRKRRSSGRRGSRSLSCRAREEDCTSICRGRTGPKSLASPSVTTCSSWSQRWRKTDSKLHLENFHTWTWVYFELSDVYVITCSKFSMFQIFKFIELFEQNVRDSK